METPVVGARAPRLVIHSADGRVRSLAGATVLAFVHAWSPARDALSEIRAELRGLGATMIVLSDAGAWSFAPDDDVELWSPRDARLADEVAVAARSFGVADGADAVFVLDDRQVIRFAQRGVVAVSLATALAAAGQAVTVPRGPALLFSRREWAVTSLVAGFAFALLRGCKSPDEPPPPMPAAASGGTEVDVTLDINGQPRQLRIEPRVSLLDALRERLGLPGTKKGCDHGQCGACTVLVDGRRVLSCLSLAVMQQGAKIQTIEGLAHGDELHPMQAAFVQHDGFQCGYCTPGQIMSAVAMLAEGHATTDDDIREQMSGNLCRCGAYPNILAAIRQAQTGTKGA
jgi:xanthine dehydrogenase YagT iron-sulfur-binding subunit